MRGDENDFAGIVMNEYDACGASVKWGAMVWRRQLSITLACFSDLIHGLRA